MELDISQSLLDDLIYGAFRYYFPRQTACAASFASDFMKIFKYLSPQQKELLKKELRHEISKAACAIESDTWGRSIVPFWEQVLREMVNQ